MAAPKSIPGVEKPSFLHRKAPLELVIGLIATVGSLVAALRLFKDPTDAAFAWGLVAVALVLGIASIWKVTQAIRQDKDAAGKHEHEGLRGALHVLHQVAGAAAGLDMTGDSTQLRVTFHRVVPPLATAEKIEQLVDYIGGSCDGVGRTFSIRSGITGKAIRDRAMFITSLQNDDEKARRSELKQDWGYTDNDLKTLSMDRLSSMAVPVLSGSGQDVLGVVYLDSDQRDLFADAEVQGRILSACGGIIAFVNERYAK